MDHDSIGYTPRAEPKRGGCLAAWLIVMVLANVILATFYASAFFAPAANAQPLPAGLVLLIVVLLVANAVFAVAIWRWQRWGVYGFATTTSVAFLLNVYLRTPVTQIFTGFIGLLILIALVRPVWAQMR